MLNWIHLCIVSFQIMLYVSIYMKHKDLIKFLDKYSIDYEKLHFLSICFSFGLALMLYMTCGQGFLVYGVIAASLVAQILMTFDIHVKEILPPNVWKTYKDSDFDKLAQAFILITLISSTLKTIAPLAMWAFHKD